MRGFQLRGSAIVKGQRDHRRIAEYSGMKAECHTLEWIETAQMIKMTERGQILELGTTANGWSVVAEFWKFMPGNS